MGLYFYTCLIKQKRDTEDEETGGGAGSLA
jgi:hypothetical protein